MRKIFDFLYKITSPGFYCELNFKISHFFYNNKLLKIFYYLYWPIWRIVSVILGCEIYGKTKIGKGLKVIHFGGIFIKPSSKIGINCILYNNITIGGKGGSPIIGNNCIIGAGARILGDIKIGNNCVIGANCVVTKSFGDNVVLGGVPAKIIKYNL